MGNWDSNEVKLAVGNRFRRFRKSIAISHREAIAGEVVFGFPYNTIFLVECGAELPSFPLLHYVSNKYHLNVNWLFTGKGEMILGEELPVAKFEKLIREMNDPQIRMAVFDHLEELIYKRDREIIQ